MLKHLISGLFILLTILKGNSQASLNNFKLTNLKIPLAEIKRGGPPRDGIPSIDKPKFYNSTTSSLPDNDRILGVSFNSISKAYPINIMNWHEIVNDDFDGHPVVVTYCPLCGSGISFDALIDKETTTFGVSGLLYNSDVLLYDRQSESLWSQIEMMGVAGQQSGKSLKYINTSSTTWGAWKKQHPNSLVLSKETGFNRNYEQSPYASYAQSEQLMFPVNKSNDELSNKELVIGVTINKKSKAYPLIVIQKQKSEMSDQLGGQSIFIKYNRLGHSATILGQQGKIIPSVQMYWFAWQAFHPNTSVYK